MKKLLYPFFAQSTTKVAKELLGKFIVLITSQGKLVGKIVETEAYHNDDPASHAYKGLTPRNKPMFGPPGFAYVYFTYGMHYCFNVVTEKKGKAGAVLIRAVEPLEGIEIMKKNRSQNQKKLTYKQLTNGPAKFTQAFGIDKKYNEIDLTKNILMICTKGKSNHRTITAKRVGISAGKNALQRFYIENNPFVSVA